MNPWTALLESLHSALIDELIERHPEPKPELGMPIRQKIFAFPSADLATALVCDATFALEAGGESAGFAILGADALCEKKLNLSTQGMWEALLKRAGREFDMRKIRPRVGSAVELRNSGAVTLPRGFAVPSRVVWVPFKLNPGICYLGVGT
jgi:hypothetical protein